MKRLKFSIIIFYVLLFAGLALYDERPDPELAREMARPLPEVIEQGNAWIAFLGLTAQEGVSPYTYGEKKMRDLKASIQAGKNEREVFASSGNKDSELSFQGKLPSFYSRKDDGILAYAMAHPDEVSSLYSNNAELLRRYDNLRTYPRYTEPLELGFYAPIPSFSPLRNMQRVKFLILATKAKQGDLTGALEEVRKDAEFWRFIARNSNILISKLISISAITTDLRFAAELGASRQLNKHEMAIIQDILKPFDNGDISLVETFRGEARYSRNGMELSTWKKIKSFDPEKLLFKHNATNNRMYAYVKENIRLAELAPRHYADELKQRELNKTGFPKIGVPFLYNSIGEILAEIAVPQYSNYIEKGHNIEGLRRLSQLKVLLRQENVSPEQTQQFLNVHSKTLGTPYTNAPMTWDAQKGSLSFRSLSGEKPIVEMFL